LRRACAAAASVGVVLSGCTATPDDLNPQNWMRDVSGWFGATDKDKDQESRAAEQKARASQPQASEAPFPKLSSVPERPPQASSEERKKIVEGLVADRANARYSDDIIRRQTDSASRPPAAARAAPAAADPPKPSAEAAPPSANAAPGAPSPGEPGASPPSNAGEPAPPPPPPAAMPTSPPPRGESRSGRTTAALPEPAAPPEPASDGRAEASPSPESVPPSPPSDARARPSAAAVATAAAMGAAASGEPAAAPPPPAAGPGPTAPVQPVEVAPPSPPPPPARPSQFAALPPAAAEPPPPPTTEAGKSEAAPAETTARPAPSAGPGGGSQIATILFDDGSSQLAPAAIKLLERVVAMQRSEGGQLRVVGHASVHVAGGDPIERKLANFRISADRANAVARELVRLGVDPSSISVLAVSESQPLYNERVPAGQAGNRRAEIFLERRG
jgi:outer membrane protein OmpA-like peptidoglycan-associated protein